MEPTVQYVIHDGGRSASKRSKQTNDCTVRAVALALAMDYDAAYDLLKNAGRKSGGRFKLADWIVGKSWANKISFPAVKGQPRMTIQSFVTQYPEGKFIVKIAKHVYVVLNGVVHDDVKPSLGKCIYTAWQINN